MLTASDPVREKMERSMEWRLFSSKMTKKWWMLHQQRPNHIRASDPPKVFHLTPYISYNFFAEQLDHFETLKTLCINHNRLNEKQVWIDLSNKIL